MDGISQQLDRVSPQLAELASVMRHLSAEHAHLVVDVGSMRGTVTELRYWRRAPAYFSRVARRLRVIDTGDLANLLDDAVDQGRLEDRER